MKLFFILFFIIQFYLTLFGGFLWPFSSHWLFSQYPKLTKNIIQIGINHTSYLHCGNILDLEYSRCSGLIRNIYQFGTVEQKQKLYQYLLYNLNYKTRFTFDEMLPKVTILTNSITIEEHLISLSYPIKILNKLVIYPSNDSYINKINKINYNKLKPYYFIFIILITYILINNNKFDNFLFNQSNVNQRFDFFTTTLALIVIILFTFGPYGDFYAQTSDFLFTCKLLIPFGYNFYYLKYLTIILAIFVLFIKNRLIIIIFTILLNLLQYYITCFNTSYWITNTHINIFAILVCISYNKKYKSFTLAFAMTYIAMMYFQAGLSKLIHGGLIWFITGKRIWVETILLGTNLGKSLLNYKLVFMPMGWFTFIFECVLAPLLINKNKYIIYIALLFHFGTFIIMGISFWFIWLLFPALFFIP